MVSPLAGQPVPKQLILNIPDLVSRYYTDTPDVSIPDQKVSFGTSGHRGTSLKTSFNDAHIAAITQAICDYRKTAGIDGPLFLGMDTHALSTPAHSTAIEVLAANGVFTRIAADGAFTPTPVISHAIICYNRNNKRNPADGIVVTPSHNPPTDGGFKYNPTHGGPADTDVTKVIADKANQYLADHNKNVKRMPLSKALASGFIAQYDYMTPYINDLKNVVDMEAIAKSGISIGADALGGAGLGFWAPIAERYGLNITVRNDIPDPTFKFMSVDHDGKIRMDCSSKYAMTSLIGLKEKFDIAFGNDPDFDRHGIVTPSAGLMNPNHYLAVAIQYLFKTRTQWPADAQIGKTLVSSSMIDRVGELLDRKVCEVPVGFKWFVPGLSTKTVGFGGEESAGASFLRFNGDSWTTDKDGIILALLAAEITATTGKDPAQHYQKLVEQFGTYYYERIDSPATAEQKAKITSLTKESLPSDTLAGDKIEAAFTNAPGNGASIGGLKIVTKNGWCAVRPSGTENICKLYAESFVGPDHLKQIQAEGAAIAGL